MTNGESGIERASVSLPEQNEGAKAEQGTELPERRAAIEIPREVAESAAAEADAVQAGTESRAAISILEQQADLDEQAKDELSGVQRAAISLHQEMGTLQRERAAISIALETSDAAVPSAQEASRAAIAINAPEQQPHAAIAINVPSAPEAPMPTVTAEKPAEVKRDAAQEAARSGIDSAQGILLKGGNLKLALDTLKGLSESVLDGSLSLNDKDLADLRNSVLDASKYRGTEMGDFASKLRKLQKKN